MGFHPESQFKKIVPEQFPLKIMGYLGAFFPDGFDFDLLDQFVSNLTDWGFVLVGRTNPKGMEKIEKLQRYRNFFHRSWVPRQQLFSVWQSLSVNLMLYRSCRGNAGAFPVKYLESLQFRVPSVATRISKTEGLDKWIPLSSDPQELIKLATEEAQTERDLSQVFEEFFFEMHPKIHLAKIAEALS
jgi:glycosyltransferase involved in cell wall biosynthesis